MQVIELKSSPEAVINNCFGAEFLQRNRTYQFNEKAKMVLSHGTNPSLLLVVAFLSVGQILVDGIAALAENKHGG